MDAFQHPDYYQLDDLLSEEHKMVRDATRDWIKRSVKEPICSYTPRIKSRLENIKRGEFDSYVTNARFVMYFENGTNRC